MKTFVALLRGINVGGKNLLPMAELKALLDRNGYESVSTYIQSGNVVYRYKEKNPDAIADLIELAYSFRPAVMVLDAAELGLAARGNPYPSGDGARVHFFFCAVPPGAPDVPKLQHLKTDTEQFELKDGVFYLSAPEGIGRSKLAAAVERYLGVPVTARNLNTVNRLLAMIDGL